MINITSSPHYWQGTPGLYYGPYPYLTSVQQALLSSDENFKSLPDYLPFPLVIEALRLQGEAQLRQQGGKTTTKRAPITLRSGGVAAGGIGGVGASEIVGAVGEGLDYGRDIAGYAGGMSEVFGGNLGGDIIGEGVGLVAGEVAGAFAEQIPFGKILSTPLKLGIRAFSKRRN